MTLLTRRPSVDHRAKAALSAVCEGVIFCDPANLRSAAARIANGIRVRMRAVRDGIPLAAAYAELAFQFPLQALLARRAFELIQIDYWNLGNLGLLCQPKVPRCFFLHDVQPNLMDREAAFAPSQLQAARLRRAARKAGQFEFRAFRHFSHIFTVTEADAAYYRGIAGPTRNVQCIPTLFDASEAVALDDPGGFKMVFVGAMRHRPNTDAMLYFVREVLPIIRASVPQAELAIVGRDVPDCIHRLRGSGVSVVGSVESVRPYLESAALVIAPLRFGSGIKLKILEALAYGKALITTPVGAEGIEVRNGEHCFIANDAQEFAKAAVQLLRDAPLRNRIGRAGRRMIEEKHSLESAGPQVRAIYRQVIEEFGRCG